MKQDIKKVKSKKKNSNANKSMHKVQKQPPEVSCKKRCSKRFCKIHRKTPQACNVIKKETLAQVLSCEFCEISKNTFFAEDVLATASESNSQQICILNILGRTFDLSITHSSSYSCQPLKHTFYIFIKQIHVNITRRD